MPSTSTNTGTLPAPPEARIPFPTALLELQHYVYQTYLSSSSPYTQSSLFTQYAPLTILLSIFALPRFVDLSSTPTSTFPWYIFAHLLLGACAGLVALRVLIWIGARMVWAFCEFDLAGGREGEKIRGEGHCADREVEMELTQGNLIFGGLFG